MKIVNRSSLRRQSARRQAALPMAEINIIPLVDIVLVLLIIFMATTAFVKDAGLNAALPQSKTADAPAREAKTIVVTIAAGGALYLEGNRTSGQALRKAFSAARGSQTRVIIRGDENIEYKSVVRIRNIARQEGLAKNTLSTRPS
ncbi:MAG TPA: biopolymer transporter ExbD [Abditibacteriaceae bacterium]